MSGIKVDFGATDAGFTSTIQKVNGSVDGMEKNVKQAGTSMKTSFASMVKAGAALAIGFGGIQLAIAGVRSMMDDFGQALDMGGRLNDLSARTGETAGNLLLLERAFQNSGAGADKVGPAINKLQRAIVEAGQGSQTYTRAFSALGLSFDEIKGMTPTEQMKLLAERISAVQSPTERSAIAMQLLGRSGGELIPLFRNFTGELATAQGELGSLPGIMDKSNASFDAISDKIAVVKGKFTEFAAGILSGALPAIELVVTALARIDAAAIGAKLADIFVGGKKAMDGFSAALAALKMGDFSMAVGIAFESIKLQVAQTANSIYANFRAAIAASVEFIKVSMGPGSGIWTIITAGVDLFAAKLGLGLSKALLPILSSIPGIGEGIEETIKGNIKSIEADALNASNRISNSMEQIPGDFKLAAEAARTEFEKTLKIASQLIDTTEMEIALQGKKAELIRKQGEEARKAADEAMKSGELEESLAIRIGGQRVSNAERIKELETEIKDAKAQGNEELARELEAQKAYYTQLESSLTNNKTLQESLAAAGQAYAASIDGVAKAQGKVTKELQAQLTLTQQLAAKIKEAEAKDKIDRGGGLEKQINEAINRGDFRGAERINKRLGKKEERGNQDAAIREAFGGDDKFGRNLKDIAKEQGIDTFRKGSEELRKELAELAKKRQAELAPGAAGKDKEAAKDKPVPAKDPMQVISDMVKDIKELVAKIEPKLPQHALI